MERLHKERGFTLIEVLVALAIIAVAMAAAVRVAGLMTQSNGLLRDRAIALLSAQNSLAELRLERGLRTGTKTFECNQGRLHLRCEQTLTLDADGYMLHASVRVWESTRETPPLARLETLLNPVQAQQR